MRLVLVPLVAALLLIVGACGGDGGPMSEQDYRETVGQDISGQVSDAMKSITNLLSQLSERPDLSQDDRWLSDLNAQIDKLDDSLERTQKVTPPAKLVDAHDAFLMALECSSDGVAGIRDELGDLEHFDLAQLGTCQTLWDDAEDALDAALD